MTENLLLLQQQFPYKGLNIVQVSSGEHILITCINYTTLPLGWSSSHLINVYIIPSRRKNLLSIAQISQDNHVLCYFDARHFYIFDLTNGSLLYQKSMQRFSKIPAIQSRLHAMSAAHSSLSLWHHRLGHPSAKVMSVLASSSLLSSSFIFRSSFWKRCALGKSTRLPFHVSIKFKTYFPYTLIHSDIWQSPVFLFQVINITFYS